MNKRWTALILVLLLLFNISACGQQEMPDESPIPDPLEESSTVDAEDTPEPSPDASKEDAPPEETVSLEAQRVVWDPDRASLPQSQMPDSYGGLELPVRGATGYTSIQLPLWANIEDCEAAKIAVAEWNEAQKAKRLEEEQKAAQAENQSSDEGLDLEVQADESSLPVLSGSAGEEDAAPADTPEGEIPLDLGQLTETAGQEPGEAETPAPSPQETEAQLEPPIQTEPPEEEPPAASEEQENISTETEELEDPPTLTTGSLAMLPSGTPFTILKESGGWWQIAVTAEYKENGETRKGEVTGWVEHRWCFINLPDVIPSIIYNATNSYDSRFVSCGKRIAGVTGEAFYPGKSYNSRLKEDEFMMPVLYSMSFKLCQAQQNALAQGNSLVLYEGYRPYEVQKKVVNALTALTQNDPEVKAAVSDPPWSMTWFIATGYSNHQFGYAVDVSLARVDSVQEYTTGGIRYIRVEDYALYEMPTPIHELSRAAATFTAPVASHSATAWKSAELSPSMNQEALGLQGYCTSAKLTPLSSEWWHFNDLDARLSVLDNLGIGDFIINSVRSTAP